LHRKGQITIFIILAIVIIFSLAVYLYLKQKGTSMEESKGPVIENVPFELQPLNSFVETCIVQVSTDGLEKLGLQGGYIEPLEFGFKVNPAKPTDGDAIEFLPGSDLVVPYWFYMKSDNKCSAGCEFAYNRPQLYRSQGEPSIEGQLDAYVNKNLAACLGDFASFTAQGYTVEIIGPPKTQTTVFKEDIGFFVEYPLKVIKDGREHYLERFFIRVPLNLKSIYEQASLITNLQSRYQFLEKDLLNMIVGYSRLDSSKLPPMAATDFEFGGGKAWPKYNVGKNINEILSIYIPSLQVYGSASRQPVSLGGDKLREGLYNTGMLVINDTTYPELEVTFNYLDFWPVYFDLNCEGEICKPESASSNIMALIGVQRYNFLYDISFPVVVSVYDPRALNLKGYEFQFMLEGNVRDNEPMDNSYVPLMSAFVTDSSMVCDLNKRNSGNVTINVKNALDQKPLDNVEVTFTCTQESCPIGKTRNGILDTEFPVCMGGIVGLFKEGYLGKSEFLTTELQTEQTIDAELMPKTTLDFFVEKYKLVYQPDGLVMLQSPVELDDDEYAMIQLKRLGSLGDEEYSVAKEFHPNDAVNNLELVPGNYEVSVQFFLNQDISILPQERCQTTGFFGEKTCYSVPQQTTTVEKPVPVGGLRMNYTFTMENIKSKRITLYGYVFYIGEIPEADRVIEDLEPLGKIDEYSIAYKSLFEPKFG
jgi:hypothetical protein